MQSCRFHLQNFLRKGRSVDAWKRRQARLSDFEVIEWMDTQWSCDPRGTLETREILSLLSEWLTPREKRIVECLAERWSAREISLRLGISHTLVLRERRRIAAVAAKLGLAP